MQCAQNGFPQGESQNRCPHAGGLIEGIGCKKVLVRDQHWNRCLLRGSKELGQDRFKERHSHQSPVPPWQAKPKGPRQKKEGGEHHQQGS